jgi:DNA-binding response OmpR family regulator
MNKKILVVEDDVDTARLLKETFKETGYEIITVYTGVDILRIIRLNQPDLILLDIMLPEKDGFEVCREVRADKDSKKIPVVVVSAKVFPSDIEEGMKSGADEYITKPFDPYELVEKVKKYFN